MRDRLLVRHFLWRFLDHDLISPNADRRVALSAIGGAAASISLFVAVLIFWQYQLSLTMPPGIASIRSLDDRFLFIASSMLMMAMAAVAEWDALALDARDTAALGALPIPRSLIVRAKFVAIALFASGVLVAWNLAPMLFRAWSVPGFLRIGIGGALRLTLAQGAVTLLAGAFAFLAVLAVREVTFAVLGARRFQSVTALLQAVLVVLLTTGWLLLPLASVDVAKLWFVQGSLWVKAFPPLWFIGLHEALAGSVIDGLPRTTPEHYLILREIAATENYRGLWPTFYQLAGTAVMALAAVAATAFVACWWNSRRLPTAVHRRAAAASPLVRQLRRAAERGIVRHPTAQAGFFFALQTLTRRGSHRVPMAAAVAAAVSLVVIMVVRDGRLSGAELARVPVPFLAVQPLVLAIVLGAFRHAARVPADLRASSTFTLAWTGNASAYLSGVRRAGWLAVALPTSLALAPVHAVNLGPRLTALHFAAGLAVSALLLQVMFLRYRRLPFVSSYAPPVDARSRAGLSVAALIVASFVLAAAESAALASTAGFVTFLALLAALTFAAVAYERTAREKAVIDVDEQELVATLSLNLARS